MPSVRKQDPAMARRNKRKPVSSVPNRKLQSASVRKNPGRRKSPAVAPAAAQPADTTEGAGLIIEGDTSTDETTSASQETGPSAGLKFSAGLQAAADPIASPAQAADGIAGSDTEAQTATLAPAGGATPADIEQLEKRRAEARLWINQTYKAMRSQIAPRFPNSAEVLADDEWRNDFADALGEVMDFYGLDGADVIAHPLAKLGVISIPLGMAAWADYKLRKEAAAAAAAAAPKPAEPIKAGPAATFQPPPSDLHTRA